MTNERAKAIRAALDDYVTRRHEPPPIGGMMALMYKDLALSELTDAGTFKGYLATWDVDLENERFAKGAFTKSIFAYVASGMNPAILWQHDMNERRERQWDTRTVVGRVTKMQEDDRGLLIEGRLDLKSEEGAAVRELMRLGSVSLSVGFVPHHWVMDEGVKTFTEAEILEATVTPRPAQPNAVILEVKDEKDNSLAMEQLRSHLRSSHDASLHLRASSMRDLVLLHRFYHAQLDGWSSEHIQTGRPDDGASVPTNETFQHPMEPEGEDLRAKARADAAWRRAKEAVRLDALRERNLLMERHNGSPLQASMTLAEWTAMQREKEREAFEVEESEIAAREADRVDEISRIRQAQEIGLDAFRDEFHIGTVRDVE
jgi:Escherichia/Staphylococcus phage prohead protease